MRIIIIISLLLVSMTSSAQKSKQKKTPAPTENPWSDTRWGDLGDGRFANPVLYADYSDPEVIRVGRKYYMTCSEFHYMGMPILESDDMVNWTIIGQIFRRIDLERFQRLEGYGDGTWAPALRYHDGRFWMYVCMPNTGLYMSTAEKPEGPWSPLYQIRDVSGWEDPCPLWDEDGQAYLGHSCLGGGPIIIHRMSPDGRQLLDEGTKVYEGPTAEGTKLFKKDGYYYLSIPEGGVSTGWQMVLRSSSIYGPYEGKRCLEQGSTPINGPHQGALVDTPEGQWWFYHFQSHSPQGRVLHLQPVSWQPDGFPLIGEDQDGNGVGEPVKYCKKPKTGVDNNPYYPQASDDFEQPALGLQWAWNHNPLDGYWSLAHRPGWLTLWAAPADKLRSAHNTLTQKTTGNGGMAQVQLDYSDMGPGQRAGLACIGNVRYAVGVCMQGHQPHLYLEREGEAVVLQALSGTQHMLYLQLQLDDIRNQHHFLWSQDGQNYQPVGEDFTEGDVDWKGYRIGLYTYSTGETTRPVYFDNFQYTFH